LIIIRLKKLKKKKVETKEEVIGSSNRFTLAQISQFQTGSSSKKSSSTPVLRNEKKALVKWLKTYKVPIYNASKVEIGKLRFHLVPLRKKGKFQDNLAEVDVFQYWRDKILKPLTENEIENLRANFQRSKEIISTASLRLSQTIPISIPNNSSSTSDEEDSSDDDFTESYSTYEYKCDSKVVFAESKNSQYDEDEYGTDSYADQEVAVTTPLNNNNNNNKNSQNSIEVPENVLGFAFTYFFGCKYKLRSR
jgi:hypothetical protein